MLRIWKRAIGNAARGLGKRVSRTGFNHFLTKEAGGVQGGLLNLGCGSTIYQRLTLAREIRCDLYLRPTLHASADALTVLASLETNF